MTPISRAVQLLRTGQLKTLFGHALQRLHSRKASVCLRFDLGTRSKIPAAKIPLKVRPMRQDDIPILFDIGGPDASSQDLVYRTATKQLACSGLQTSFVAVTEGDRPCYYQCLIGAAENDKITSILGESFSPLRSDQALLEGAYTPAAFRGQRIMPVAMALIAQQASILGATHVITFVDPRNGPALKGCERAGFKPYQMRIVSWFLFRRTIRYEDIPPEPRSMDQGLPTPSV